MSEVLYGIGAIKSILPEGKRFVLVGGAFDLVHIGHVHLLEFASTLEDIVVVAVLSDTSVQDYKGSTRPILNQIQRAKMVTSIRYADYVYISDTSPSSVETLQQLQPHSVVFGEEGANAANVTRWRERIAVHSPKTKIHLLPRYIDDEISTSYIIDKIRRLES